MSTRDPEPLADTTRRCSTGPFDLRSTAFALLLLVIGVSIGLSACSSPKPAVVDNAAPGIEQSTFRVRSDFTAPLNADRGWASGANGKATVHADEPFRIRFELRRAAATSGERQFRLQYRRNGGVWSNVEVSDFPYPEEATPRISIVSTSAYEQGASTSDLLATSDDGAGAGAGINFTAVSPVWTTGSVRSEWEWPLVIRRFADGAVTNEDGDTFELRMADATGCPLDSYVNARLTLDVPRGHLGGTFVETPGRIGPWEASNGDLYFIMEPSETYNALMVVKSTDGGATWAEVDGGNRPVTDDLEGFATELRGDTIHMLHQTSDAVWYHSFQTSDHPTAPDRWTVRDELAAAPPEPPTQVAAIAVRSDDSVVGVYGGPEKIRYAVRSVSGTWGAEVIVDASLSPNLSGPQAVVDAHNHVHLAYTGKDGTVWYRRIQPDGAMTARERLAAGIGTAEGDAGSILPLVYIPEKNTVVVIYRLATGRLWERRIVDQGSPSEPRLVSDREVVQNAVDSDQTGADAIAHGTTLHVLFIESSSGHVFHTRTDDSGEWQPSELRVAGVEAQWIRGTLLTHNDDEPSYGFVYDAGSNGGSGMNRYAEVSLRDR